MTEKNNIDDLFRSRLEDFEMSPSEKSWDSLDAALSKKQTSRKRKNRFILFLISFLLLLTSLISYKYYATNNSSTIDNKKKTSSNIKIIKDYEKKTSTQSINKSSENTSEIEINKSSGTFSNAKLDKNKTFVVEENNKRENLNNNSSKNKSIIATVPQFVINSSESPASVSSEAQQKTTTSEINSKIKNVTDDHLSEKIDAGIFLKEGKQKPTDLSENVPVKNEIIAGSPIINMDTKPIETKENFNSEKSSLLTESDKKDLINEISFKTDTGKASVFANTNYSPENKTDSSISFLKKIASHLSIGIFYSPDYVWSKIKINDSYTGSASQNINDYDNQKAAFSYSTGLNVRYDLGRKWSIGSGVSYSTFAQNAVYNTVNIVADSIYQNVYGHRKDPRRGGGGKGGSRGNTHQGQNPHRPPGNGNHHYVIQTSCGAIDLYNEPPHFNRGNHRDGDTLNIKTETSELLQFINIPLNLRYRFGQHKLSYFVEAGAAISFVKGDVVKITIDDSYTENNERDGLRNINYSFLIGAGVNYNFYKGLNMSLKPSFRYSLTPVNLDNPMYSYLYYIGIEAGFSIHF